MFALDDHKPLGAAVELSSFYEQLDEAFKEFRLREDTSLRRLQKT